MAMRQFVLALLLLAATACDLQDAANEESPPALEHPPAAVDDASRDGLVYGAVVRQLVEVDHGFGTAPSPYRRVFVTDGVVAHPLQSFGFRPRKEPFDAGVKLGIVQGFDGSIPLTFVRYRRQVIGGPESRSPGDVCGEGVLVNLGRVNWINSAMARVANNRWATGKDGQWLVYTVKLRHGQWRVTGVHGPVLLS